MGCVTERNIYDEAENIIQKMELKIAIKNRKLREIDIEFSKYSNGEKLNKNGLNSALSILTKNKRYLENKESVESVLYETLLAKNLEYDLKNLIVIHILISKEKNREKARILFNNFDRDESKKLDKKEIKTIVETIINYSVTIFLDLAISTNKNFENELKNYKKYLEFKIDSVIEYFIEILNDDERELSLWDFIDYFQDPILLPLLSSSYLRKFITNF